MRFLSDLRLYADTDACLRFLRNHTSPALASTDADPERYHLYWRGTFGPKQAFVLKSFLATQHQPGTDLWLWLDADSGYDGHTDNPYLQPLLGAVTVKRFAPSAESLDTPVAERDDLYEVPTVLRSDFFRYVVLYKYGGTYVDFDVMFLRDLRELRGLPEVTDEFCYWWPNQPFANTAVLRLAAGGAAATSILERAAQLGTCHPGATLSFPDTRDLDLLVLPSACFDPLWLEITFDATYRHLPFTRFSDFFRRFAPEPHEAALHQLWWLSLRDNPFQQFFPGAFSYHWHNYWTAPEHLDSYFGVFREAFNETLSRSLHDRLTTDTILDVAAHPASTREPARAPGSPSRQPKPRFTEPLLAKPG
jgi:hypothetical protein